MADSPLGSGSASVGVTLVSPTSVAAMADLRELADHRFVSVNLTYRFTGSEIVEPMLNEVSETERSTYERIHCAERRFQFLLGRFLLRRTLGRLLQIQPRAVPITVTGGRPRIASEVKGDPAKLVDFNISHCTGHVLVALTVHGRVGADVEITGRFSKPGTRFLSLEEHRLVDRLPAEKQADALCHFWTVKEACLKALGMGLDFPFRAIPVSLNRSGDSLGTHWETFSLAPSARSAIAIAPSTRDVSTGPGKLTEASVERLLEDGDFHEFAIN